jgi:hypothetical protein
MLALQVLWVFLVNKVGEITAIIQDHVQALATGESSKSLLNAPCVLLLCLTLPGKDGNTRGSDATETWLYAIKIMI